MGSTPTLYSNSLWVATWCGSLEIFHASSHSLQLNAKTVHPKTTRSRSHATHISEPPKAVIECSPSKFIEKYV
jgi:hypothetical protein